MSGANNHRAVWKKCPGRRHAAAQSLQRRHGALQASRGRHTALEPAGGCHGALQRAQVGDRAKGKGAPPALPCLQGRGVRQAHLCGLDRATAIPEGRHRAAAAGAKAAAGVCLSCTSESNWLASAGFMLHLFLILTVRLFDFRAVPSQRRRLCVSSSSTPMAPHAVSQALTSRPGPTFFCRYVRRPIEPGWWTPVPKLHRALRGTFGEGRRFPGWGLREGGLRGEDLRGEGQEVRASKRRGCVERACVEGAYCFMEVVH